MFNIKMCRYSAFSLARAFNVTSCFNTCFEISEKIKISHKSTIIIMYLFNMLLRYLFIFSKTHVMYNSYNDDYLFFY